MTAVLLIVIYICFIGLGIPDSLLGASWPAMRADLALPLSYANFVSVLTCACTILMCFWSARIVKKCGTRNTVIASTAVTALALLGYALSRSFLAVCLLAVPMGLGAGAIDAGINNYVALHYSEKHMNFLHCFYGVGISVSPYLMSYALQRSGDWHNGFRYAFYLQMAIAVIVLASYPLWDRRKIQKTEEPESAEAEPFGKLLRNRSVMVFAWAFFASCAIESVCNLWGASYLRDGQGFTPAEASGLIVLYYAGLALSRFLSGLLSGRYSPLRLMLAGEGVTAAAIALLFLPVPPVVKAAALFLVGFGNGPAYPNLMLLIPKTFSARLSQSVIGFTMGFAYTSTLVMPILFGQLAQHISIGLFGWMLLALYAIMMAGMLRIPHAEKGNNL